MKTSGLSQCTRDWLLQAKTQEEAYWIAAVRTADRVTSWEQANHKWRNQTGRAERGLSCIVARVPQGIQFNNAQLDPERWMLETMMEGRYAILREALRRFWPSFLQEARTMARQMGAKPR